MQISSTDQDPYQLETVAQSKPREREALEEASETCIETLESIQIPEMVEVLESQRRVRAILGVPRVSDTAELVVAERPADISWEIASFRHVEIPPERVELLVRAIAALEFSFYPVVSAKARYGNYERGRFRPDWAEVDSIAWNQLHALVWDRWNPSGNDPLTVMMSLRRYILATFYYLPSEIDRRSKYSFERRDDDQYDETKYQIEPTTETITVRDIEQIWADRACDYSLTQIFTQIKGHLSPRQIFALLDRWGYYHPEMTEEQRSELYGFGKNQLRRDYSDSLSCLLLFTSLNPHITPDPTLNLKDLSDQSYKDSSYFFDSSFICKTSIRPALRGMTTQPNIFARLTDSEVRILGLATARTDHQFQFTIEELATMTNLALTNVYETMNRIMNKLSAETPQTFVLSNGKTLQTNSSQHLFIKFRQARGISQLELQSQLTPRQREVLVALTTPDIKGRYIPLSEAIKKLGFERKIIGNIRKAIELVDQDPNLN